MKKFRGAISIALVAVLTLGSSFLITACRSECNIERFTVTVTPTENMTIELREENATGAAITSGAEVKKGTVVHVSWAVATTHQNTHHGRVEVRKEDNTVYKTPATGTTVIINENKSFVAILTQNTVAQGQVSIKTVGAVGEPFGDITSITTKGQRIVATVPTETTMIVADLGKLFKDRAGLRGADFSFTATATNPEASPTGGIMLERIQGAANPADYLWRPVGTTETPQTRDRFSNFVMYWYADANAGDMRDQVHFYINVGTGVTAEAPRVITVTMTGDNNQVYVFDLEIRRATAAA